MARCLLRVPVASPAVRPDILQSVCARQVLRGESGASKRSADCGGLGGLESSSLLTELVPR